LELRRWNSRVKPQQIGGRFTREILKAGNDARRDAGEKNGDQVGSGFAVGGQIWEDSGIVIHQPLWGLRVLH